ncbi:MAG: DNA polymerase V subunit UmuC [Gammaproteobacteria bacterium]|nr:DNA polymerase V subunit UmuC [Gammaproteobacteria bacterium]
MFMLVDCNCFYVSCERVFRPDLDKKPVIVLSNNDGCVIALSKEAKSLGIKMCDPWFKIKDYYNSRGVVAFSSNYELYADLSYRIMNILESLVSNIEVYSIDEAFVYLKEKKSDIDINKIAAQCMVQIRKCVGIPVRIGIGPTKTISKIASYAAKYHPEEGILDLSKIDDQYKLMKTIPVQKVWGIGLKLSNRLNLLGINTAFELLSADILKMKKIFGISLVKTIMELNGHVCIELQHKRKDKKQIIVSRTFNQRVTKLVFLEEAISDYTFRAAEKLRRENQLCKSLIVFLRTGLFVAPDDQYRNHHFISLIAPTDDTRELISAAKVALKKIYRPGYSYAKVGIIANNLSKNKNTQVDMFSIRNEEKKDKLMKAIDDINLVNKNKVGFLAQGIGKSWSMKRDYHSPKYTTSWYDLPEVI